MISLGHDGRDRSRGLGRSRREAGQVVCPPLWWCCMQGALLLTPWFSSQLFRSGSWFVQGFLYLVARNCPSCLCYAFVVSLLQFLCIFLLEEMFVQEQALQPLQQRVPGPSLSHCEEGGDVETKAERAVRCCAEKSKKHKKFSPLRSSRRKQPCPYLHFSSMKLFSDFRLPELQENTFVLS